MLKLLVSINLVIVYLSRSTLEKQIRVLNMGYPTKLSLTRHAAVPWQSLPPLRWHLYISLELLLDLQDRDTYSCGTLRADRGNFSKDFKLKSLEKGEADVLKYKNIHWKDRRDVYALSSIHGSSCRIITREKSKKSKNLI